MNVDIGARVRNADAVSHNEQIEQLFGENVSDRLLADFHAKRDGRMNDTSSNNRSSAHSSRDETRRPAARGRRTRVGVAAAAFLGIVAIGVLSLLTLRDGDGAPGEGPDSPLEVAEAFMAARDAWDGEAVRSLVADDAKTNEGTTPDDYVSQSQFDQIIGWRLLDANCTAGSAGSPAQVSCTYSVQNAWGEALGVGPFPGNIYTFTIEKGKIQQVTNDVNTSDFSPQVWGVFRSWMEGTHPDDVAFLYPGFSTNVRKTPEALALWEQYTEEFVTLQTSS